MASCRARPERHGSGPALHQPGFHRTRKLMLCVTHPIKPVVALHRRLWSAWTGQLGPLVEVFWSSRGAVTVGECDQAQLV
jgi:hypothetical protein